MKLPMPVRIMLMPIRLIGIIPGVFLMIFFELIGEEDIGTDIMSFIMEAGNK
jgi:hypothetical protein